MASSILARLSLTLTMLALSLAGSRGAAQAQNRKEVHQSLAPVEQYLSPDRGAEVSLARSAAPDAISSKATVLVLTRRGYETAERGSNGFVCLVERNWQAPFVDSNFFNPRVRAPTCYNPQAAKSVVPVSLKRTEMALAGVSKLEMMARLKKAFAQGELSPPAAGAMAYMMSKNQYLDDNDPRFQPHLMFIAPNTVTAKQWGANLPQSPVIAAPEQLPDGDREPLRWFVVPVQHWSDGSRAGEHESK
jgi:hypothetical protein